MLRASLTCEKKTSVVMNACNRNHRGQRQEDWWGFLIINIASDLDRNPVSREQGQDSKAGY